MTKDLKKQVYAFDREQGTAKVSVIIPVYNESDYILECLDSIVNQTLKDIEIICVNDASTDNSLSILKEYASKDKRIRIKPRGWLCSESWT